MKKTPVKKERWEYHIHYSGRRTDLLNNKKEMGLIERELNQLGKEGWEIIKIIRDEDNFDTFYFKRKK